MKKAFRLLIFLIALAASVFFYAITKDPEVLNDRNQQPIDELPLEAPIIQSVMTPVITSISPQIASIGETIIIKGSGFSYKIPTGEQAMGYPSNRVDVMAEIRNTAGQSSLMELRVHTDSKIEFAVPKSLCIPLERGCNDTDPDSMFLHMKPGTYSVSITFPHTSTTSNAVPLKIR